MPANVTRLLPGLVIACVLVIAGCSPNVSFSGPAFRDLGVDETSYTVAVGVSGGFLSGAEWTATASQPWISVSPGSGRGAATATISVDRTGLDPDAQINSATVTFTSSTRATFTTRLLIRFKHTAATAIRGRLFIGGTAQGVGATAQGVSTVPVAATAGTTLETRPWAASPPGPEWVEGEVLVVPAVSDPRALAQALGASDRDISPAGFVRVPALAGESVPAAVARLRARPDVAHAQPNYIYRALGPATGSTNDPFFPHQWNLWSTRVSCQGSTPCTDAAWLIEGGATSVRVAVLDTGILSAHEEWLGPGANPIVDGYDFIDGDNDPDASHCSDPRGYHGQQVAGIIGATSNNAKGIAGAARAVTIVPVRVLGCNGSGTTSLIADGIRYAAGLSKSSGTTIVRAHVINLSFGAAGITDAFLENAVNEAHAAGSVLIAASGNAGTEPVFVPARYANTVAVGSVDLNNVGTAFSRSSFSSFGPELDLVAPGGTHLGTSGVCVANPTTILSTWTAPSVYVCGTGTSLSTPLVSAVAALMLASNPTLSPDVIKAALRNYTQNLGRTLAEGCPVHRNETGCGVLDAHRVVAATAGPTAVLVELQDEAGTVVGTPVPPDGAGRFEFTVPVGAGPYRVVARRVSDGAEVGRYFRPNLEVLVTPGVSGVNFGISSASLF